MNHESKLSKHPANKHRRGQILPLVALSLMVMLGFTGLVIDTGQLYVAQRALQASTNAAALAGGQCGPSCTSTEDISVATTYSSVSGEDNARSYLSGASMVTGYPKVNCSTTLENPPFNIPCIPIAGGYGSAANEVVVQQQVTVPLTFMGLFGFSNLTLNATATAAMRGSAVGPYNIAVIVDTTGSMNDIDSDSQCGTKRITCALAGVRTLLNDLSPCSVSGCGTFTNNSSGGGANATNPLDRVSLFTFPSVTTATVSKDYGSTCAGTPTAALYQAGTFPNPPATATYQVVNFSSDYRTSDTATSLNTSSNIVQAIGATSSSTPCLKIPGGINTYYAGAIYQAQAALIAEQALVPHSQNVMIILSDGDANAYCTSFSGTTCTAGTFAGTLTTNGNYMGYYYECTQATIAAQAATAAGTLVYSVAYGSTSAGCTSDNSSCPNGEYGATGYDCVPSGHLVLSNASPCWTMQNMASNTSTFFSDYTATGGTGTCLGTAQPTTNLNQIFAYIAAELSVARLVPNGT